MFLIVIDRPYHTPVFTIATDDGDMYRDLCLAYGPFVKQTREKGLAVRYAAGVFTFEGKSLPLAPQEAMQAIENIIFESTGFDEGILPLHAAAMGRGGKASLFLGSTGSGKSTLSAYLALNGAEYLSDDLALVNKESLRVLPYPRPIQLRQGGYEVLRSEGLDVDEAEISGKGELKRYVLTLPAAEGEYEIEGIYCIERSNENSLCKLNARDAYMSLMENLFRPARNVQDMRVLRSLLEPGVYQLRYRDKGYVSSVIGNKG